MMLFIATIAVIFCNLFLGVLSFRKNSTSATNRLFLILAVILSLWAGTNYLSVQEGKPEIILFYIRIVMVVMGATFPVLYLLTNAFPGKVLNLSRKKLVLVLGFTLVCQTLAATPLVFSGIIVNGSAVNPIPGPGMILYGSNVICFFVLTLVTLIKKIRTFSGIEKTQVKFLALGIGLTFTLTTATNFILVNLLKITALVSVGPLFTLILVGFISYSIIRHQFLDIRLVLARTVSYLFLIALIAGFYATMLLVFTRLIFPQTTQTGEILISVLSSLVIIFTFQTIKSQLEKITDAFFFHDNYSSEELLGKITNVMARSLEMSDLVHDVLSLLLSKLH